MAGDGEAELPAAGGVGLLVRGGFRNLDLRLLSECPQCAALEDPPHHPLVGCSRKGRAAEAAAREASPRGPKGLERLGTPRHSGPWARAEPLNHHETLGPCSSASRLGHLARLGALLRARCRSTTRGQDRANVALDAENPGLAALSGEKPGLPITLRCHLREHLLVAGAGFEPATFGL